MTIRLSDGKARSIRSVAATGYWGPDGRPMTAAELLDRLLGDLGALVGDEDQLRRVWSDCDTRERFLGRLAERGLDAGRPDAIRELVDASRSDLFDVPAHVLYAAAPRTRRERAEQAHSAGLGGGSGELRALLPAILAAYAASGAAEPAARTPGQVLTARHGSESRTRVGDPAITRAASLEMQVSLYRA